MTIIKLETLSNMIEDSSKIAIKALKDQKSVMPTFIGYTPTNERVILTGEFRNQEEKAKFLKFVKISFAAHNVDKYAGFYEAWVVENIEAAKKYKNFADCPERINTLTIMAINNVGKKMMVYEIQDDFGLKLRHNLDDMQGVFADLLPNEKLNEKERTFLLESPQSKSKSDPMMLVSCMRKIFKKSSMLN